MSDEELAEFIVTWCAGETLSYRSVYDAFVIEIDDIVDILEMAKAINARVAQR